MTIKFISNGDGSVTTECSFRLINIGSDGGNVFIDGSININELEQILTKMKELRDEKQNNNNI